MTNDRVAFIQNLLIFRSNSFRQNRGYHNLNQISTLHSLQSYTHARIVAGTLEGLPRECAPPGMAAVALHVKHQRISAAIILRVERRREDGITVKIYNLFSGLQLSKKKFHTANIKSF